MGPGRFLISWLLVLILPIGVQARPQQSERPLPELAGFLDGVRTHLRSDRLLLSQYTYTEKDIARELDKKGNVKSKHELVYEVYPSLEEGLSYRRLISKDGKPSSQKEIDKQDRAQDKKMRERAQTLAREGTDERARRQAKEAEEKRKEDEVIDELFKLYEIHMTDREILEGNPAIVLTFQPRAGYKPRSKEAKSLAKVAGSAWFGEQDHELIRIEFKLLDDFSLGLGLVLRLDKGAAAVFQRRRINGEIWLPAEVRFNGTGRLLLFKGLKIEATSQYSDYRKFTVETEIKFRIGKNP
jgi:hypothetical protein